MGAIGLNPIRLDAIGLDPIRFNAIKLGVPGASSATDRPYISPDVLSALAGVWIADGKSNTDPERNIIKNKLPGRGGDFEILNAAYKLNSGYGVYNYDFTDTTQWWIDAQTTTKTSNKIICNGAKVNSWNFNAIAISGYKGKLRITGLTKLIKESKATDVRISSNKTTQYIYEDGDYEINVVDTEATFNIYFRVSVAENTTFNNPIIFEQIPEHEGAFVTDGVNDMIVSQNPVSEMLGGSKELTVVSMIHQISPVPDSYGFTNYIREGSIWSRTNVKTSGKTGIYGYKISKGNTEVGASNLIDNILGDKADYEAMGYNITNYSDINYSVTGYIKDGSPTEVSSVAWYWTFIAKRALTTDEINQVIAYFNLDKYVKPDIYYDVKKQGLTNDNHAQFGDKLIDYSGNSRDLQLFNIGWNPGSGIGKYVTNFGLWSKDAESNISYNSYSFTVNGSLKRTWLMWYVTKLPSFKIKVSGINSNGYVDYGYYDNGSLKNFRLDKDGIHTLPPSGASSNGYGFKVNDTSLDWTGLVIEQIPDFAGALCFDGVDDYGQFVGDLGLKDYTVIFDRAYPIVSKRQYTATSDATGENSNTPFLLEHIDAVKDEYTYSYLANTAISINKEREICYQSTYQYKDTVIKKGSSTSLGTGLTIARYGINNSYSALALYSFMLFHYSMSKFLIERQLKKHKLGTLYPSMVEFRPIISGRTDLIKEIKWYSDSWSKRIYVGDYIPRGVDVTANILLNDNTSELVKATYGNNYTEVKKQDNWSETNNEWDLIIHNIGKSPQKIDITIDEYIRYEDIMHPYPAIVALKQDGRDITWGDKLRVGSEVIFVNHVNLLPDLYTVSDEVSYNGTIIYWNTPIIVAKSMIFTSERSYLKSNEPKCILSPSRLRIPNSSYKILGYIPDISGHGNHGVLNNSGYTDGSGVNADGSYQLDGVDDFISIPTTVGGKQVLMKVNWSTLNGFVYDQRPATGEKTFGIYTAEGVIAYSQQNNGNTYIDGIVNNNVIGSNLSKITHNVVATCDADNSFTPSIGKRSYSNSYFAQMSFYDFMLFDEISTDQEIKDLNNIVGIIPKIEFPPYYWDTYGKTNTDADRDEIVNLANDEVSIQYPTDFADTSVWEDMGAVTSSTILTLTTWAMGGDTGIGNTIKAKVATPAMKVKFITDGNGYLDYMYSGYNTLELPRDAGEYEVELPSSTIVDGWGARFSGSGNGSFTIELLGNEVRLGTLKVINSAYNEDSGYRDNGIVLDGVDDSLVNTDIPAFTDFTVIAKRTFLGDQPDNGLFLFKGDKVYAQGVGNALLMEYRYDNGTYANYIFANANSITLNEGDVSYVTPTDYNGQQMSYVVNTDNKGLVIGRSNAVYWKGVFYKLMLYPKTIDILSINMLKNLFERDDIIDLNNPIFKV